MPQPAPPLEIAKTILEKVWFLDCPSRSDVAREARKELKGKPYRFPLSTEYWDAYRDILRQGKDRHENLEKALRVKDVRTDSGIAPVTLLTKPYPCPGRCVYCPTEVRMPKSYISSEPAAARALSLEFDPYEQVRQRVSTLERHGHQADKIELIIKGGTWSAYTEEYRVWFITRCFEAANDLPDMTETFARHQSTEQKDAQRDWIDLAAAHTANETAGHRIIGLTIETRPDWITPDEVINLRKLGVTRVELGLQIINDRILGLTKRGTTVDHAARAIALLKTAGFKVDVHILPGQPGATVEDDLESFRTLFGDPRFRPDMVKLYPCVVMPGSELEEWMQRGDFKPLEGDELKELLIKMLTMVPRYCRIPRVVRDFPTQDITAGNKESNLREGLEDAMKKRGISCVCLRCREVGHVQRNASHIARPTSQEPETWDAGRATTKVFEERYENAGGTEVFLSVEDEERKAVFGFLRMRLPFPPDKGGPRGVELKTDNFIASDGFLPYKKDLTFKARDLRKYPTPTESKIWLRILGDKRLLNLKFTRQKPIDNYIVDFYCSELRLAIEVDGDSHALQAEYDSKRTKKLNSLGVAVLRYANRDVINNLEGIFNDLVDKIEKRKVALFNPPQPSLIREGERIFTAFPVLRGAAIIRELHTYGTAIKIDTQDPTATQHKGYGRLLMQTAEDIARRAGCETMAVISGIGVREYYKSLGYGERDTYMAKKL